MINKEIFCSAPFRHLHIDKTGDVLPCCGSSDRENTVFGNISDDTIENIYNSDVIKKFRLDLLNGVYREACSSCYQIEKHGGNSLRQGMNKDYPYERFKDEINEDGSMTNITINYLDIRFSNFCNFKCRMCDGKSSSSIEQEHIKLGISNRENPIIELDSSKLYPFLESQYSNIEKIYFAGGEPLILKEHYYIIDRLVDLNKTNISLFYNTNLSTLKYKDLDICDLWPKFDSVTVYASLDGINEIGEYIRHGLDYKLFEDNFFKIKSKAPNVLFSINVCVSLYNIFHLFDMIPYLIDKKIMDYQNFSFSSLTAPYYQSITLLPIDHKNRWSEMFSQFRNKYDNKEYKNIFNLLYAVESYMYSSDDSAHLNEFYKETKKLDIIRNKDFYKIYTDLMPIKNDINSNIL